MNRIITTMDDNANLDSIVNHLISIIKELYRITLNIEERIYHIFRKSKSKIT